MHSLPFLFISWHVPMTQNYFWLAIICIIISGANSVQEGNVARFHKGSVFHPTQYRNIIPLNNNICRSRGLKLLKCDDLEFGLLSSVYYHVVFDFERPSSMALFVNQICMALTWCIRPNNFRLVIHGNERRKNDYLKAAKFLSDMHINYITWIGEFDTVSLQRARMKSLEDVTGYENYILQVDEDEFPDIKGPSQLNSLILDMSREAISGRHLSSCDARHGQLVDKLPFDGSLRNATLRLPLTEQFPLSCNVKKMIETAESNKLVIYRANYRPSIGNHKLICERKSVSECVRLVQEAPNLSRLHPHFTDTFQSPRRCSKLPMITINHYKYTWGLHQYLAKRVDAFKKLGLQWHTESTKLLDHLQQHNGTICVACQELNCTLSS